MFDYISGPAILLLIGGLLSVGGAFWAGINSSKQERVINDRNFEIAKLTVENRELSKKTINLITGGESYAYYVVGARHQEGIYKSIGLTLRLDGNFPLSDVTIKMSRLIESKNSNRTNKSWDLETLSDTHYPLITHDLFSRTTQMPLIELDDNNTNILINISSRNGEIEQQMKFAKKENGYYSMATKIVRYVHAGHGSFKVEPLFENIDKDYPESIDWLR